MAEAVKAGFQFEKFTIPNFSYNESKKREATLNIEITPKGTFNNGIFDVEMDLTARDEENLDFIILNVKCIASFRFDDSIRLSEVPKYFYKNSAAIVFPYIRAFISNLTLQANTGLILLGLMNLSNMEQELIDNTTEILSD